MHETQQIAYQVTEYLNQTLCLSGSLTPDTDLLEEGLVDSLMILDLVEHLRTTYSVHLTAGDSKQQHFRSARALSELVVAKREAAPQVSMS